MAVSCQRSAASIQILLLIAISWSPYKIMGPLKKASVYQLAVGSPATGSRQVGSRLPTKKRYYNLFQIKNISHQFLVTTSLHAE
jgi:hypothetical protein